MCDEVAAAPAEIVDVVPAPAAAPAEIVDVVPAPDRAESKRKHSKERRDRLLGAGFCINGESHGKATKGAKRLIRCDWCDAVYHKGIAAVLADPDAPPKPANYVTRAPRSSV